MNKKQQNILNYRLQALKNLANAEKEYTEVYKYALDNADIIKRTMTTKGVPYRDILMVQTDCSLEVAMDVVSLLKTMKVF